VAVALFGRWLACDMARSKRGKGEYCDNAPTGSWCNSFENERIHGGERRLYRSLLQPKAPAFDPWLSIAGSVHATTMERSTAAKTGSVND